MFSLNFNFNGINFNNIPKPVPTAKDEWITIHGDYQVFKKVNGDLTSVRWPTDKTFNQEEFNKSFKAAYGKAVKLGPFKRVTTSTPMGEFYHYEAKIESMWTAR